MIKSRKADPVHQSRSNLRAADGSPCLRGQLPSLSPCLRFKKSRHRRKVSARSAGLIARSLPEGAEARRIYSARDSSTPIAE